MKKVAKTKHTLSDVLKHATPDEQRQIQYLKALNSFDDYDFSKFWDEYLPSQESFRNKPEIIRKLKLTHELIAITNNNAALIIALQKDSKVKSIDDLFDLQKEDWLKLMNTIGVIYVENERDVESQKDAYATYIIDKLNTFYPNR